jgi:hypothetical protein
MNAGIEIVLLTCKDYTHKLLDKYVVAKTSNIYEAANGSDAAVAAENRDASDDLNGTQRADSK